jgi:hypothetical protein
MTGAMPQTLSADEQSQLTVARLSLEAAVLRDQPGTVVVTSDAQRFASHELAPALTAALAPLLDGGDPSVWVIRRLDLDLAVDSSWSAGAVAARLARAVQVALHSVTSGEGAGAAVRFPDRAAYLAQFLSDLTDGHAWDRWYYPPFAALRPLPISTVIRLAIEAQPGAAENALLALAREGHLARVVQALNESDAARLLARLTPVEDGAAPDALDIEAAADIITNDRGMLARLGTAAASLVLYLELRAQGCEAAGAAAAAGALIDELSPASAAGSFIEHAAASPDEAATNLEGRTRAQPAGDLALRRALRRMRKAAPSSASKTGHRSRIGALPEPAPFAGVFLLWRSIVELGIDAMVGEACDADAAAARRHLLAARLAGRAGADTLDDAALRWLTGYDGASERGALAAAAVLPAVSPAVLYSRLAERLARVRPPLPVIGMLEGFGARLVLSDPVRGDWLWAGDTSWSEWREDLAAAVVRFAQSAGGSPVVILPAELSNRAAPTLAVLQRRTLLAGGPIAALHDASVDLDDSMHQRLTELHALVRPAELDLAFFAMPDWPGLDPATDLAWSVLARAAYSDLARRLPGLAHSSAGHLWCNVASGIGSWHLVRNGEESEARVRLPVTPLRMLLRMVGINETRVRLGGGRTAVLLVAQE